MINIYASMMRIAARLDTPEPEAISFDRKECRNRIKLYAQHLKAN
jgi:hypothetical protein